MLIGWTPKSSTVFCIKTLHNFLYQYSAQLLHTGTAQFFFFYVDQMNTKTLHSLLHENLRSFYSADQMKTNTLHSFLQKKKNMCSFLHQNPVHVFTPNPCTAFCSKILHSFLHQNHAQLSTPKTCADFIVLIRWTPKPCRAFYRKTLRCFLHENPEKLFTPKPCAGFYT